MKERHKKLQQTSPERSGEHTLSFVYCFGRNAARMNKTKLRGYFLVRDYGSEERHFLLVAYESFSSFYWKENTCVSSRRRIPLTAFLRINLGKFKHQLSMCGRLRKSLVCYFSSSPAVADFAKTNLVLRPLFCVFEPWNPFAILRWWNFCDREIKWFLCKDQIRVVGLQGNVKRKRSRISWENTLAIIKMESKSEWTTSEPSKHFFRFTSGLHFLEWNVFSVFACFKVTCYFCTNSFHVLPSSYSLKQKRNTN